MSKFIYVLSIVITLFAACPARADDFDQRVAAAAATIQASGSLKALDTDHARGLRSIARRYRRGAAEMC
jgi:hypothetical protein